MNPLLYGHNTDERIVAVYPPDDRTMRVVIREPSGIRTEDHPFFPYFYLTDDSLLRGFRRKHWIKRLEGGGAYQMLCAFEEWPHLWEAVRHILDTYNRTTLTRIEHYSELEALYLQTDPVTQFLAQTGRTMFKGLEPDDLHRMQLDIETYSAGPHRFSNANRPGDRIILIALSDNRGWKHLIDGKKLDERAMLTELVRIVRERDPDVLEGHNILGFDLPYISSRCTLHRVPLGIGRDGSVPRTLETRTAGGDHPFDYTITDIAGRHVIDTLLLVQSYDAVKRTLESYGLKYVAQYFGIASEQRTYIKGDRIAWHWDHDVKPLMAYAMDDVSETAALSSLLSPTSFYLTQMVPAAYGVVSRLGAASKIELLLVREYLRRKHALPRPRQGSQTSGGYTDIFLTGIVGPIVHADVESLYPSIMITQKISPESDELGIFTELLSCLTTMRLEAKRTAREATVPIDRARLDAVQSSLKILINSFYGYLGYSRALFNDYGQADTVTRTGQSLLRTIIARIQSEQGKVVEVDTDGVFFVPPPGVDGEEREKEYVANLGQSLPQGISLALDGRHRKMLSYKKKNYALLDYDNRIRIKGSSLISRSMEHFGRTFIHQCIDFLINHDIEGLHNLYVQTRRAIQEHTMDVRDFARVEVLRDSIDEYQEQVRSGKRNRSAAYEVAIASGKVFRRGDRVGYYITGSDPNVRSFEYGKAAEEWDPNFPDENIPYYLRRLDEFSEKFLPLFEPVDFRRIFTGDDLFPFNPKGISLVIRDVAPEGDEAPEDPRPPHIGIWLDE
jgi:DNA polymerase, archaea type